MLSTSLELTVRSILIQKSQKKHASNHAIKKQITIRCYHYWDKYSVFHKTNKRQPQLSSICGSANYLYNQTFLECTIKSSIYIVWLAWHVFDSENHQTVNLPINNFAFYLGIFLTGIGSMYYHHQPCSETLVWDRLPMTISFMAFFSIIIGNCICISTGKKVLFPLILLGLISIIYWQMTKSKGTEDLRFYAFIQFLPIVLIPIILILFKNNNPVTKTYWYILIIYVIAKICEANDEFIFTHFKIISGHSLKHLAAATVPFVLLRSQIKTENNFVM